MSRALWFRIGPTLAALSLVASSFAAPRFPDYPVKAAREYSAKVSKAGILVAVEPVWEIEQEKKYFDANLRARGYVPVLLVIEDASPTDEFLFDYSAIGLPDGSEVVGKSAKRTANSKTSGGIIDLTLLKTDSSLKDVAIRENLIKRHIRSTTLGPGSTARGFVYIPVSSEGAPTPIHLQIPLTNAKSGEIEVFDITF
jgi:hypothetical protein